jgi:hypothetical protein
VQGRVILLFIVNVLKNGDPKDVGEKCVSLIFGRIPGTTCFIYPNWVVGMILSSKPEKSF